jgi:hypothetical protein
MPLLSLITHYYNNVDMVKAQISYWESLPPSFLSQVEFILIDDGSEQLVTFHPTQLDLKVFRIKTAITWNQPGARNLGTFNATGRWALFFDIDQKFYAPPLESVLTVLDQMDPNALYYLRSKNITDLDGKPLPFHSNTILVNLPAFKSRGLYDEDFAGHYGFEDLYMAQVWEKRGGRRLLLNDTEYFEDLRFRTVNLDRDLSRNHDLAQTKLRSGVTNSPGILRFEWETVPVEKQSLPEAVFPQAVKRPA